MEQVGRLIRFSSQHAKLQFSRILPSASERHQQSVIVERKKRQEETSLDRRIEMNRSHMRGFYLKSCATKSVELMNLVRVQQQTVVGKLINYKIITNSAASCSCVKLACLVVFFVPFSHVCLPFSLLPPKAFRQLIVEEREVDNLMLSG